MFQPKQRALILAGSPMPKPSEDPDSYYEAIIDSYPGAKLIAEALAEHPDLDLERHLNTLAAYGFDPRDPDIISRAIKACIELQYGRRTTETVFARNEWLDPKGSLIYYMRLGNRVKIGTTTNLRSRLETINPEELITLERGGLSKERERHAQFSDLRANGEWFRLEEPLLAHMHRLASAFKDEFGQTLYQYTQCHRLVTGLTCDVTRSSI